MEKEIIETVVTLAPVAVALGSTAVAFVKGLQSRKSKKSLNEEQQRNDLRAYMIKRCEVNELFAPVVRMGIKDKHTVSAYKKATVINDCTIYAKACGYAWYNEYELSSQLDDYVSSSNVVAGKATI